MKQVKITGIGAALLLSCGIAQAASYNIGTLSTTPYSSGVKNVVGSFSDTYTFDLTTTSAVGSGITNIPLYLNFGSINISYDINSLNLAVFDSSNTMVADVNSDPLLFNGLLSAGNGYSLKVTGTATGNMGGLYTLGMVAAPVPEADAWAMMGAGLGLLGWRFARRQGSTKKQDGLVTA